MHSRTKNDIVRTAWVGFAASRHDPTISSDLKVHSKSKNDIVRTAWVGLAASRHGPTKPSDLIKKALTISSDFKKTARLTTILLEPPGWGLLLAHTTQLYLQT